MPTFRRVTRYPVSVETLFGWHRRPGAFLRMVPPWETVRVEAETGGVEDGGTVRLGIRRGPSWISWTVRFTAYEENRLFRDEQVEGPFGSWRHTHRFHDHGAGASSLEDEVEWTAPLGGAGAALASSHLERQIERIFAFRHLRLRNDLALLGRYAGTPGRRFAVTGASGLIGSALTTVLRTHGHEVLRVTRSPSGPSDVGWDPSAGTLDRRRLEGLHGVVHLAGESIAGLRWTREKKRRIRESRTQGTGLLAESLAGLETPPPTLVSASGVNYYGDRGSREVREGDGPGPGFLPRVCVDWEAATAAAEKAGIRTVHLRTGMVLSPAGGALPLMLPPFRMGLGGRLGKGDQYMSWVDLDDHVGLVLHALNTGAIVGPMNSVSPRPVTNEAFTSVLGRVLDRPTLVPVPAPALRLALGEMGRELLLSSVRAAPVVAMETGYDFLQGDLEGSLSFQLGREGG